MISVRLGGATRLYAIVGDPIAQVRSPQVYSERFAALGANAILVPVHVPADRFEALLPALMALPNLDGLLVTVPFKARALPFAGRLGVTARTIGALNALRREPDGTWTGDMFDGTGFVRAAQAKGCMLAGRRVTLFGAGGAGSAIGCELAAVGVARIALVDPLHERAQTLATRLRAAFPECDVTAVAAPGAAAPSTSASLADTDMIVNASTVGMRADDGLPGDVGRVTPSTLVGDVIVGDAPTALLRLAREHGCPTVSGTEMLAGQAGAIVDFFAPAVAR